MTKQYIVGLSQVTIPLIANGSVAGFISIGVAFLPNVEIGSFVYVGGNTSPINKYRIQNIDTQGNLYMSIVDMSGNWTNTVSDMSAYTVADAAYLNVPEQEVPTPYLPVRNISSIALAPATMSGLAAATATAISASPITINSGTMTLNGGTVSLVDGPRATYSAAVSGMTPLITGATDVMTITGSASKIIRISRIIVTGSQTTAGSILFSLLKRSTLNTGGSPTTLTTVPHDSRSFSATSIVTTYAGSPSLGTLVGSIRSVRKFLLALATVLDVQPLIFDFGTLPGLQEMTLTNSAECLSLNLSGLIILGGALNIAVEWTESTS